MLSGGVLHHRDTVGDSVLALTADLGDAGWSGGRERHHDAMVEEAFPDDAERVAGAHAVASGTSRREAPASIPRQGFDLLPPRQEEAVPLGD